MRGARRRVLGAALPKPVGDPVGVVGEHHLEEHDTRLAGEKLEPLPVLGPAEELRNDHVVLVSQVGAGKCDRKIARDELGLVVQGPLSELRADRVDVDDKRERMIVGVLLRERRLADAGRTVDEEEHAADGSFTPSREACYTRRMSENLRLLGKYSAAMDSGATDAVFEFWSDDFVSHVTERVSPERVGTDVRASEQAWWQQARAAFPDMTFSVNLLIEKDDLVVSNWTVKGTHTGTAFYDVAPSGNPVVINGTAILRVRDGKVVEHWGGPPCQKGLGLIQGRVRGAPDRACHPTVADRARCGTGPLPI